MGEKSLKLGAKKGHMDTIYERTKARENRAGTIIPEAKQK